MGEQNIPYILGIDLGSASLGWGAVRLNGSHPGGILASGVRIFDPGVVGSTQEIELGKDQSKNLDRRTARLHRRQLRRRAARQRDLFVFLQKNGLLPGNWEENSDLSASRHNIIQELDAALRSKWRDRVNLFAASAWAADQVLPYFLRTVALDEQLEPHEIGRALYHLAQRRGFKSNRRETKPSDAKKDETSQVKQGISELESKMIQVGARTLGEFFCKLDPRFQDQNIRRRWTARRMFEHEFEQIWIAQAKHHPTLLTEETKRRIYKLLFYQRPIASNSHLIGMCELEPKNRRAPWACLDAQRFRVLQSVNNLRVLAPDSTQRTLTTQERDKLLNSLEYSGTHTFARIRELLGLPKRGFKFNLELGGETRLRGNRTAQVMHEAFAERWEQFTDLERDQIVEEWRTIEAPNSLVRRAVQHWTLEEQKARLLADAEPEDGYCNFSRKALRKLLPYLEGGDSVTEAIIHAGYPDRLSGREACDELPPVREVFGSLRNPAVERAVTELRKVVNAIVRQYGKPWQVRIELGRDLKKPKKERLRTAEENRKREKERLEATKRLLRECGIKDPSRDQIEKVRLLEECGEVCPYTGRAINMYSLFVEPQFHVEHILPLRYFPDNSFANKTLCYYAENQYKGGRTPYEAYGSEEERWDQIIQRVKKFKGPSKQNKLRRFELMSADEIADFSSRQLNDTRYMSKLAAEYVGLLYGGRDVQEGESSRQVVYTSSGTVTATLRRMWKLESILREAAPSNNGHNKGKPRTDHRHHAVDAITVALTTTAAVQSMNVAAVTAGANGMDSGYRSFRTIPAPWPDFVDSVRPHIEQLVVSHRPKHKLNGPLHDETFYGKTYSLQGKSVVNVRKSLSSLSAGDIKNIVDPAVKNAVQQRLDSLGGDIKKLVSLSSGYPYLKSRQGQTIPIKKVRIRKALETTPVGKGARERWVSLANNHHIEIFAELDAKGNEKNWEGIVVSLYEAMERNRKKQPIVSRTYAAAENYAFKFSLMGGDIVDLKGNGKSGLYRVRTIATNGQVSLVRVADARLKDEIKKSGEWWSPMPNGLRSYGCQKVVVDMLGRVHSAND